MMKYSAKEIRQQKITGEWKGVGQNLKKEW